MGSYTRQQLEIWLKTITVSGRVLDVGGSQKPAKGRIKVLPGTTFHIFDLEKPHEGEKPDLAWDLNEPIDLSKIS
ncbi:hypothetical protein LCGC14_3072680, partial [marine sediment metagenome]